MARRASVLAVFKCCSCEDALVITEEVSRVIRAKSRGVNVKRGHLNDSGKAGCHCSLVIVQSYMWRALRFGFIWIVLVSSEMTSVKA